MTGRVRVLWLTNDLPPRAGGIEQFVANLARRVDPEHSVVLGPAAEGAAAWDAAQPFDVVRAPVSTVLPTPRILRLARTLARRHRPDVVVLGASWPLGELGPALGRDPGLPVVALTHGLEAGFAQVGLGYLVRRATRGCAAVTTISDFAESRLGPHLRAGRVERVPPGVDIDRFRPGVDGEDLRAEWGVPRDALTVGCISRLVRRKGQDALLGVWPAISRRHPGAWLVLVGEGPLARRVVDLAAGLERVVVAGPVSWEDLPAAYGALDVFAMPCRTRLLGVDVEGLGIVYLEAQSCGIPVLAGTSGGAPEAVRDGETGIVVDGRDGAAMTAALDTLVTDPVRREQMGRAGRAWVKRTWSWEVVTGNFTRLLEDVVSARHA